MDDKPKEGRCRGEKFDYMKLADRLWDGEVVSYIAKIHECKGRQELFTRQKTG